MVNSMALGRMQKTFDQIQQAVSLCFFAAGPKTKNIARAMPQTYNLM
jgi:hypothetical protein